MKDLWRQNVRRQTTVKAVVQRCIEEFKRIGEPVDEETFRKAIDDLYDKHYNNPTIDEHR